jgi:hypothetical protein
MPKIDAKWGAIGLIVFGFIAGGIVIWQPTGTVIFVAASAGYVFTGLKYLYDNNETVYLTVQRWRCVMLGLDTTWNFIARITTRGPFDIEPFRRKFMALQGPNNKIITQTDGSISITFADTSFVIFPVGDEELDIHVNNINVSYRRSDSVLDERIGPLIEMLQRELLVDKASFFLDVKFSDINPFLGGYLRRIAEKDLKGFNVSFVFHADEVTVTKDNVKVKANSFSELVSVSRRVLALSPGNS